MENLIETGVEYFRNQKGRYEIRWTELNSKKTGTFRISVCLGNIDDLVSHWNRWIEIDKQFGKKFVWQYEIVSRDL